ncbi:MAG: hypothetical protein ACYC6H_09345 [Bellilinea sp.]
MLRKNISQPTVVTILLILQFIPLLLFPVEIYSPTSQQWWLPVILTILAILAVIKITIQRSSELWPWYLVSFSQGFNIISRLMMLMPHATYNVEGSQVADIAYIITNVVSILISAGYIIYAELPDVRLSMLAQKEAV